MVAPIPMPGVGGGLEELIGAALPAEAGDAPPLLLAAAVEAPPPELAPAPAPLAPTEDPLAPATRIPAVLAASLTMETAAAPTSPQIIRRAKNGITPIEMA